MRVEVPDQIGDDAVRPMAHRIAVDRFEVIF
jgi:hypothetical protein